MSTCTTYLHNSQWLHKEKKHTLSFYMSWKEVRTQTEVIKFALWFTEITLIGAAGKSSTEGSPFNLQVHVNVPGATKSPINSGRIILPQQLWIGPPSCFWAERCLDCFGWNYTGIASCSQRELLGNLPSKYVLVHVCTTLLSWNEVISQKMYLDDLLENGIHISRHLSSSFIFQEKEIKEI